MTSRRLQWAFSLVLFLLLLLAARLFHIQVLRGVAFTERAERQFLQKVVSEATRGDILDRKGRVLASSVESRSIYAHPGRFEASPQSLQMLGTALNFTEADLHAKLSGRSKFVWLARKVSPAVARKIADRKIPGLGSVSEQKRYYPNGELACHLIGPVGLDNSGLSGVEQHYNSFLRGRSVTTRELRDAKGRMIGPGGDRSPEARMNSVTLSIDRSLQYIAENELRKAVDEYGAESGMALIQDPGTGEILAAAGVPGFDLNLLSRGILPEGFANASLRNPLFARVFEPGSTFKVVTLAAALNERLFSPADVLFCENGRWSPGAGFHINDHEPEGRLTFAQVLEKSSNIGAGKIGLALGKERFFRYARAFGFGTRTGIQMPGESDGLLRPPEDWSGVSLPVLSFGQEIGVTAVQMIGAFSAIANGGTLMEPMIVKSLQGSGPVAEDEWASGFLREKGRVRFEPRAVRAVVRPETARAMRELMARVVKTGTGRKAAVMGYTVAGKTGTAQKIDHKTGRYHADSYLASFCGFLPAENPALVCLVLLDNPRRTYWGGETAAPVFARIMSRTVKVLGIPPDAPSDPRWIRGRSDVRVALSKRDP
ncbi:MAG: hypothetical protein A2902_05950 [Elusimicrobia bacterium RIFCSPLOWO2_01_FULL_64_13]|nr:MAG: hypothetical protein A2636_06185 [Elusimicrobia bacterium RIFCSPHIGHO2_01_FULL_64_10]OGR95276.1 MAG: hypothetical protein A2902_05950 [Elusimicrobia bacterium RIFCSPLOWO2_01_FULL_64_13]